MFMFFSPEYFLGGLLIGAAFGCILFLITKYL